MIILLSARPRTQISILGATYISRDIPVDLVRYPSPVVTPLHSPIRQAFNQSFVAHFFIMFRQFTTVDYVALFLLQRYKDASR